MVPEDFILRDIKVHWKTDLSNYKRYQLKRTLIKQFSMLMQLVF